jgi:hypothetical protein
MRSHHDLGGLPAGRVEATEHDYALWEKRVDALLVLLSAALSQTLIQRGVISIDELGRKMAQVEVRHQNECR